MLIMTLERIVTLNGLIMREGEKNDFVFDERGDPVFLGFCRTPAPDYVAMLITISIPPMDRKYWIGKEIKFKFNYSIVKDAALEAYRKLAENMGATLVEPVDEKCMDAAIEFIKKNGAEELDKLLEKYRLNGLPSDYSSKVVFDILLKRLRIKKDGLY